MDLIDTWNINSYICKVLHKARMKTLTCLLSITVRNPSPYYLLVFLIICPMCSHVLYYNIEKSGFNAVFAYLLPFLDKITCIRFWLGLRVTCILSEQRTEYLKHRTRGPRALTVTWVSQTLHLLLVRRAHFCRSTGPAIMK